MEAEFSSSKIESSQQSVTFQNGENAPECDEQQAEFDALQENEYDYQDTTEARLPDERMQDSPKRARFGNGMTDMPGITKHLPVPLELVQTLLQSAGDGVSILGDAQYLASKDMWRIPTNQSSQGRKCVINPGITHDGTSVAILFIKRDNNDFLVKFHCTSGQCVTCPNPTIGCISMDMDTYKWQIKLSHDSNSQTEVLLQQAEAAAAVLQQQAAAVESYVRSLKSYNPRICEILSRLAALEPSFYGENSKLWLQHSARFGYLDADTQMALWNRHLGDTHLSHGSAVGELRDLSRADNPPPDNKALNNYDYVKRVVMSEYGLCMFGETATFAQRDHSLIDDSMLKTLTYINKKHLFRMFAFEFYYDSVESQDGMVKYKKKRFIDSWIKDADKSVYQFADIDPRKGTPSSAVYNMWGGFYVQRIPRNISAIVGELSARIIAHIRTAFACENTKLNDFILDLLAHYHHKPWVRTNVVMFIYGLRSHGMGKPWFTDLIGALMGSTAYAELYKLERPLFRKHSRLCPGRIVVHIEETNDFRRFHSDLKYLTTASKLPVDCKEMLLVQPTHNYANFIITADTMNAVFVPFDDPCIFAIKVSSGNIGDDNYFYTILDDIKNPAVLRDFYDYLGTRDLSRFEENGMQSEIPKTDFWMSCLRMGRTRSVIHSFQQVRPCATPSSAS
jgi:hypothetical protein